MKTAFYLLTLGAALPLMTTACGPDGKSLGETVCPPLPLYQYVFDGGSKQWVRVTTGADGGEPLDQDAAARIERAEKAHCIEPPGNAVSVDLPNPGDAGSDDLPNPRDAGSD